MWIECVSHAEKDVLIFLQFDLLEALELRLDEVERKVKKTSSNSSQPLFPMVWIGKPLYSDIGMLDCKT